MSFLVKIHALIETHLKEQKTHITIVIIVCMESYIKFFKLYM